MKKRTKPSFAVAVFLHKGNYIILSLECQENTLSDCLKFIVVNRMGFKYNYEASIPKVKTILFVRTCSKVTFE